MKKTISISISGIVFHVEEDAYERLHSYLQDITRYFQLYEDAREIVQDIEARIAELLQKQLGTSRQAVTVEDVRHIVHVMGSLEAIAAVEEAYHTQEEKNQQKPLEFAPTQENTPTKLQRDTKRKLLAGVLAGVGHYLKIDPFWCRLTFLAFFFGLIFFPPVPGLLLLAYLVLWIVMPGSAMLEEQQFKKLYRNSSNTVIGGVCSGIAAYFKVDVVVVRVLFVLLLFAGGSGLLAYLILWAITPNATSISEQLEMQGDPVTLSNIEYSVKNRLQQPEEKEESWFTKVLLFPFRLIGMVFTAIGPLFLFGLKVLQVVIGLVLFVTAISLIVALVLVAFSYYDVFTYGITLPEYFSADLVRVSLNPLAVPSLSLLLCIPLIGLLLLGIRMVIGRKILTRTVGLSLAGLWTAALVLTAVAWAPLLAEIDTIGEVEVERMIDIDTSKVLLLDAKADLPNNRSIHETPVQIRGYEGNEVKLVLKQYAQGSNEATARANAAFIELNYALDDSTLVLPANVILTDNQPYRGQRAKLFLFIPFEQPFVMTAAVGDLLEHTLGYQGFARRHATSEHLWKYDTTGKLINLTLGNMLPSGRTQEDNVIVSDLEEVVKRIEATGSFRIRLTQGEQPSVTVFGEGISKKQIGFELVGGTLELNNGGRWTWDEEPRTVYVEIVTPELFSLELSGVSEAEVGGFNSGFLEVELNGSSRLYFTGNLSRLKLEASGASEAELVGKGETIEVELRGASRLQASQYESEAVELDAHGACFADVWANERLSITATGVSNVSYKGNALDVQINKSGIAKVTKTR